MSLEIVGEICTACGDCESKCPTDSIIPHKGVYKIIADTCNECEGEHDSPKCLDLCLEDDCILPI